MKIDEIMFSDRELALMAKKEPKPKKEEEPKEPPRYMTAKDKRLWLEKQKHDADVAALKQYQKEKKAKDAEFRNSPEEVAKRKQARIDADLKKINTTSKRTKATDPERDPSPKKRPAKKTLSTKSIDHLTNVAHQTDAKGKYQD